MIAITRERQITILRHIGIATIAAVSDGKAVAIPGGVEIPAGDQYYVRIEPDRDGTYTVTRLYRRGVDYLHGWCERVPSNQLAEVVFRASCHHIYNHNKWCVRRRVEEQKAMK